MCNALTNHKRKAVKTCENLYHHKEKETVKMAQSWEQEITSKWL
nr:MAG TPA: hypothetical protein [Caudoviricetes sp.]